MNYCEESEIFIRIVYDFLDEYKKDPYSVTKKHLPYNYFIDIYNHKIRLIKDMGSRIEVLGFAFVNGNLKIGKLMDIYIKDLRSENS